jgi:hypothetical protein
MGISRVATGPWKEVIDDDVWKGRFLPYHVTSLEPGVHQSDHSAVACVILVIQARHCRVILLAMSLGDPDTISPYSNVTVLACKSTKMSNVAHGEYTCAQSEPNNARGQKHYPTGGIASDMC